MRLNRREFLELGGATLAAATLAPSWRAFAATDELATLDGLAQAELVRKGTVTPKELIEAAIARIERLEPKLNAVVATTFERAIERAGKLEPRGPFAGVPYLVKDLTAYADAKWTFGSRFFRDNVATHTEELIRRSEQAGLVVLGKSNTPEFGLLPTTEPVLHGPTRNPWSLDHSPGGSSGGAAAAVASGMVPLAQASDGGGSIRIPASCSGLFGLKISRGRNPEVPSPRWLGLAVKHCVSVSVRDSAALLDATRGPAPGDRWWAPEPERPYLEEVGRDPGKLRIAFTTSDFTGRKAHADCVAAVESTAKLLADLGHEVEEEGFPLDGEKIGDDFLVLWEALTGDVLASIARETGKPDPPKGLFEPFTWLLWERAKNLTPADVGRAWRGLHEQGYALARFQKTRDVLLTPTLGKPPLEIGEIDQTQSFETLRSQLFEYVAFTPFFNATGQPAMSVPLHWNEAGLPIGCQLVGRYGDEAMLFRLAAQLEKARPWTDRRPKIHAVTAES